MRNLLRHFEMLQNLIKAVNCRESLKKYRLELVVNAFEQERSDKTYKPNNFVINEGNSTEISREFRKSSKTASEPLPVYQPEVPAIVVVPVEKVEIERPVIKKAPKIEVPVKKKDLSYEIARACCFLIAEGEKLQKWPIIDPNKRGLPDISELPTANSITAHERSIKMRGRVLRGVKKIAIDRLTNSDNEHKWGRYLGINGIWHSLNAESYNDELENDDNEALILVQKLILQNFKSYINKIKK